MFPKIYWLDSTNIQLKLLMRRLFSFDSHKNKRLGTNFNKSRGSFPTNFGLFSNRTAVHIKQIYWVKQQPARSKRPVVLLESKK